MSGLHGNGQSGEAVVVLGEDVCVRILKQVLDDAGVAVFGRAHQGGRTVLVPDIDVSSGLHKQLDHVKPAMAGGQHEGRLTVLRGPGVDVAEHEKSADDSPVGVIENGRQ